MRGSNRLRLASWLHLAIASALFCTFSASASAAPIVFEAAGATPASIQSTVDAFRTALGTLNPNNGSAFPSGRREINWDAVPDLAADPNAFPGDFFASTTIPGRARGASLATPGTGFMVSANALNPTATTPSFGFPSAFVPFSQQRLFSPVGSTITDVEFLVPGTATPATVSAFGAVGEDILVAGLTRIEYFDPHGNLLFLRNVLPSGAGGLSFLGVLFDAGERVGRVRLTTGDAPLLANGVFGAGDDRVVLDDFIYAEPQAVPEPASLSLMGLGVLAALVVRSRRSRRS
jgi:hypothetical protein